jgi:hypothetical protein
MELISGSDIPITFSINVEESHVVAKNFSLRFSVLCNSAFEKILTLFLNITKFKPAVQLIFLIVEFYLSLNLMAHCSEVKITKHVPEVIVPNLLAVFKIDFFPAGGY